ncbi:MAG: hypothetical protein IPM51_05240 [Sphingobacteriaceae bacterium]|nr:hypothetical protein [Sphingobacteriaceae bacterium]
MNKILFLFLFLIGLNLDAQVNVVSESAQSVNTKFCGTAMNANFAKWRSEIIQTQNLVSTLKHDTCLNKKFSIVFYIVQDSMYQPGILPANITTAINMLNTAFSRICVSFENCSTVYIPKHPYNDWIQNPHEAQVTSNWYTTQTINFYLVNSLGGNPNIGGYTYMPGTPGNKDVIVMRKAAINTTTLYHLFGHFFGLPDTYAEIAPVPPAVPGPPPGITSHEWFDRVSSNCYTHGDGFCDTEADPYTVGYNDNVAPVPPCFFDYGPVDGLSKYYTPPVDNYMSEYRGTCRCRYTQEQYNFMARVILTQKLYLH